MIVTNLIGGLGNQLFQFAAGLQLSKKYSLKYYDGLRLLSKYEKWTYKLGLLFGESTINSYNDLPNYNEPKFAYEEIILPSLNGTVLNGYFQSWKYSNEVIEYLRQAALRPLNFYPEYKCFYKKLSSTNSVFFHVRRGDYVQKNNINYHGYVNEKKIEEMLIKLIKSEKVDIICGFGDDIMIIDKILTSINSKIPMFNISSFKIGEIPELILMSACRTAIIANSSFSWWGAHLSIREQQAVYYPKNWFAHDKHDVSLMCPPSWVNY